MNLRSQLVFAFAIVASIPLVGGGVGLFSHRDAARRAHEALDLGNQTRGAVDAARRAGSSFKLQVQEWKNILLRGHDRTAYDRHHAGLVAAEEAVRRALDETAALLKPLGVDTSEVEAARQSHRLLGSRYREALKQFSLPDPATTALVDRLVADVDHAPTAAFEQLAGGIERGANERTAAAHDALEQRSRWLQWIMAAGTVAGVALGVVFGWWTSHGVARHLSTVATRMLERTAAVASASQQVAASSAEVATTSSEQAAALQESSASLTEVSAAVKQNADHAREARGVAHGNRAAADRSAVEVTELQTAMKEISAASGNIAKIVKSIDEIAFQTNILALNAAVEAARAGESGAGFAVVAEEVRSLAQRSAQAARETAGKIEDAIAKSSHGAQLADRVGESLQHMIAGTRQVDELIGQIAEASAEQSRGLDQAVSSMNRIDQLTQTNASASDQTASAARQLDANAGTLRSELAQFLGERAPARATAGPAVAANRERSVLAA
ncbi:MAG: hypothetical protein HZA93_15470 [Verrucomicrobia bacterium]|nr:hypothetical protein [Verrucomicrobiota bacterium]